MFLYDINRASDEATIAELTEFMEKAKLEEITNQEIYKFARMFKVNLPPCNSATPILRID